MDFLLPARVKAGALGCDGAKIIPALIEQNNRNLAEWNAHLRLSQAHHRNSGSAFRRRAADKMEIDQGDGTVFLGKSVAGEFNDRLSAQRGKLLLIAVKPTA